MVTVGSEEARIEIWSPDELRAILSERAHQLRGWTFDQLMDYMRSRDYDVSEEESAGDLIGLDSLCLIYDENQAAAS